MRIERRKKKRFYYLNLGWKMDVYEERWNYQKTEKTNVLVTDELE